MEVDKRKTILDFLKSPVTWYQKRVRPTRISKMAISKINDNLSDEEISALVNEIAKVAEYSYRKGMQQGAAFGSACYTQIELNKWRYSSPLNKCSSPKSSMDLFNGFKSMDRIREACSCSSVTLVSLVDFVKEKKD